MSRRCLFLTVAAVLATATAAGAQQAAVEGRVVANDDGDALGAVLVEISRGGVVSETTTTASDGRFSFPAVPPGEVTLRASRDGFYSLEQTLILEPRQPVAVTVELVAQAVIVEEVAVAATVPQLNPNRPAAHAS